MSNQKPPWCVGLILLGSALVALAGGLTRLTLAQTGTITGQVVDEAGPVAGAIVSIRAAAYTTYTNTAGQFTLDDIPTGQEIELTAWARGYYITYTTLTPPAADVTLTLRRTHTTDHPDYAWTAPTGAPGDEETGACGTCHPKIITQWATNAHGQAVSNPRFFSLYNGTTLDGSTEITPGYMLDFPGTTGNCANCHAPGAGVDGYLTVDMNTVRDNVTAGIHCDFCHKVGGVYTNPATGLPYPNAPGVQSLRVLRPPAGDNIFIGPYPDVHDPDTYLPEMSESIFCAPCHQFSMWGTPIYESYTEWLASPYAAEGITCQDCHMPPTGDTLFATVAAGGLERLPESIPSHLQLGADSVDLLQNTVDLTLDAARGADNQITVTATITNTQAGHHVPTDFPGRHMILTITATDADGQPVVLLDGPTVPDWGGPQAGQPGLAYAKVLRDVFTGEAPVVSYWNQTQIASDNRIPALAADTTIYHFAAPDSDITLHATLIFRRVFDSVNTARAWDRPDIIMAECTLKLDAVR